MTQYKGKPLHRSDEHPLADNISALTAAILRGWSPEQAFRNLETGEDPERRVHRSDLTDEDSLDMLKLWESGVSVKELIEMYQIKRHSIYKRLQKARKMREGIR